MPTLLSWNVENWQGDDEDRMEGIADFLSDLDPDCLFLYELMGGEAVLQDLCARLKDRLPSSDWGYVFQSKGASDSRHCGFLYNRQCVSVQRRVWNPDEFPRTNEFQRQLWEHKTGFDERDHRMYGLHRVIVVKATFGDGDPCTLIGCHLKSMVEFRHKPGKLTAQEKRTIQIWSLQEFLETQTTQCLVMGDFNSESHESCAASSTSCNATTVPLDEGGVVSHVRAQNALPTWRQRGSHHHKFAPANLDLLYASEGLDARLTVVDSCVGGVDLSDHNVLRIDLHTPRLTLPVVHQASPGSKSKRRDPSKRRR